MPPEQLPVRREPPPFRRAEVASSEPVTRWLRRVTLAGPELESVRTSEPAASVRLLLPAPGEAELVLPTWHGNEFLAADGARPLLRTLTPIPLEPERLAVEVVVHDDGVASRWAQTARVGDPVAVSGPGRGSALDRRAPAYMLAGDETALPAIRQVLAALPPRLSVQVLVELAEPDAQIPLAANAVQWLDREPGNRPGTALVAAVAAADIAEGTRVWAAGEAAAMQSIRRHLFEARGIPRAHTIVRGYWKFGRRGDADGR
jgi:NADPH-dependent ferric siderophore reductase